MGLRIPTTVSKAVVNNSMTTSEAVMAASPALSVSVDGAPVRISWYLELGPASAAMGFNLRVRRAVDNTAGSVATAALLNANVSITIANASTLILAGHYVDIAPPVTTSVYIITGQTSTGTISVLDACCISAMM